MVILIFIFLTPKSWFDGSERPRNTVHQRSDSATVVLLPEVVPDESDRGQIEQRIKTLTGRDKVEVLAVRKIVDSKGSIRSFEVDIR